MDIYSVKHTIRRITIEHGFVTLIKRGVIRIIDKCLYHLFSKSNIQDNLIVFYSTPDFSDNARVLFEHMIEEEYNNKYQLVWVVTSPQKYLRYFGKNI